MEALNFKTTWRRWQMLLLALVGVLTSIQVLAQTCSGTGDYTNYLRAIAQRESSQVADRVNTSGYMGLFQMGCRSLIDTGYMNNNCQWTGQNGITSQAAFLANPNVQTAAINQYNQLQWGYIQRLGLSQYIGQTINGVAITQSGLIAGAHLVGVGGLQNWLRSGGANVPRDGNGVPVSDYVAQFCGYAMTFDVTTWSPGNFTTPGGVVGTGGGSNPGVGTPGSGVGWTPIPRATGEGFTAGSGVAMNDYQIMFKAFVAILLFIFVAWVIGAGHFAWMKGNIGNTTFARDIIGVFMVVSAVVWVLA
jgi:hypothetical protein